MFSLGGKANFLVHSIHTQQIFILSWYVRSVGKTKQVFSVKVAFQPALKMMIQVLGGEEEGGLYGFLCKPSSPKAPSGFPASNSFLQQSVHQTDLSKAKWGHWFPILFMINSDSSADIQGLCPFEPSPIHLVPAHTMSSRRTMNSQKTMLPHGSMSSACISSVSSWLPCFLPQYARNISIRTCPLGGKA